MSEYTLDEVRDLCQDAYEDGEQDTLDHVHECYWLIPKPLPVRLWQRFWRRREESL